MLNNKIDYSLNPVLLVAWCSVRYHSRNYLDYSRNTFSFIKQLRQAACDRIIKYFNYAWLSIGSE